MQMGMSVNKNNCANDKFESSWDFSPRIISKEKGEKKYRDDIIRDTFLFWTSCLSTNFGERTQPRCWTSLASVSKIFARLFELRRVRNVALQSNSERDEGKAWIYSRGVVKTIKNRVGLRKTGVTIFRYTGCPKNDLRLLEIWVDRAIPERKVLWHFPFRGPVDEISLN